MIVEDQIEVAKQDESNTIHSEENLFRKEKQYSCLTFFDTPADFIAFFDESINTGEVVLYPWQTEILEQLGRAKSNGKHPYKFCLCAANGSGKDAFVIAPFAMWFICCKIRSLVIITSSSGVQLTNQTEKYINGLAHKINIWSLANLGKEILKIRQRKITCEISGSEILLFATDEGAKAEGYHPIEPKAEMAIIANEAKSIKPEIFDALKRCTGFNYWINVSSPGEPQGYFYETWENWPNRKKVTYYDILKHASQEQFEEDKKLMGEHSFLFRSKWLAEFTFIGGKYVIDSSKLELMRKKIKLGHIKAIKQSEPLKIGIDIALSTNGDESVIAAFRGNVMTHLITFKNKDATILAENIDKDLREKLKVNKEHQINIDDGNVGRAVADILARKGWNNIKRILNQSAAKRKKDFRNRGAELWCKFAKLVEYQVPILLDDDRLYNQIKSRKFKESEAGIDKLTLQAKKEMISAGLPSPDRADAVVLAFADVNVNDYIDKHEYAAHNDNVAIARKTFLEEANELQRQLNEGFRAERSSKKMNLSLNALLHQKQQDRRLLKWTTRK